MTDRELMQQALDALLTWKTMHPHTVANAVRTPAIEALRARLAQPHPEPVAWRWIYDGKPDGEKHFPMPGPDVDIVASAGISEFPRTVQYLYAAPPQREWVGLTDEEVSLMAFNECAEDWNDLRFKNCWIDGYNAGSCATQAKLKEKNT